MTSNSATVGQSLIQSWQMTDQQAGGPVGCRDYCFPSQAALTLHAADMSAVAVSFTCSALPKYLHEAGPQKSMYCREGEKCVVPWKVQTNVAGFKKYGIYT